MEKKWIGGRKIFAQEDLIPGLVHKLNNHLAPVIANGQLLLPKVGNREAKKYVEKIIEETQQASQLIKDLVNFVKRGNLKKELVDLNILIEKVLETKTQIKFQEYRSGERSVCFILILWLTQNRSSKPLSTSLLTQKKPFRISQVWENFIKTRLVEDR
jgi:signal transduction histidine kinase